MVFYHKKLIKMIDFKLNGKKVSIATSWDELTWNQFNEVHTSGNDILKRLSIASGLDYESLKKATIIGLEDVIKAMQFMTKPPMWDTPVLQCGPYKLPTNHKGQYNIQFESLAQFEDLRALIAKLPERTSSKDLNEQYPEMVAIYLQKVRDKEYDHNKALEMIAEVKEMPAREVVTLGSFFLIKLLSLLTGTQNNSPSTVQSQKKKKPGSASLPKRSARSGRSRKRR